MPPFIDVGLVLGSLGHFVVPYLYTYMRAWTSLSVCLVTNSHLELQKIRFGFQIDSILNQISAPGTLSPPPGFRRSPGIPQNYLFFNCCLILELVSVSICVSKRLFSSVCCTRCEGNSTRSVSTKRRCRKGPKRIWCRK